MTNSLSPINQFEEVVDNRRCLTKRGKDFFDALWSRTGGANTNIPDISTLLMKANNLSDLTSAASGRTNLGLGTLATQNANSVSLTGGSFSGATISGTMSGSVDASTLKINSSTITASASELNKLDGAAFDASFIIGAQVGTTINVAVQLKDADNTNIATLRSLSAYFSDNSTGTNFIATAPSGAVAIGTNGALYDIGSNKKVFQFISNASGQFDINITQAGAKTFYLVLILPNGDLKISSAIIFT